MRFRQSAEGAVCCFVYLTRTFNCCFYYLSCISLYCLCEDHPKTRLTIRTLIKLLPQQAMRPFGKCGPDSWPNQKLSICYCPIATSARARVHAHVIDGTLDKVMTELRQRIICLLLSVIFKRR